MLSGWQIFVFIGVVIGLAFVNFDWRPFGPVKKRNRAVEIISAAVDSGPISQELAAAITAAAELSLRHLIGGAERNEGAD